MTQSSWQLENHSAALHTAGLSARVDLRFPGLGLHEIHFGAVPLQDAHILAVEWGAADEPRDLADSYSRGSDLIATYAEQPQYPFSPQVYWRALNTSPTPQLELWVSVQTRLLDARPEMRATTRVPAAEVLHLVDVENGAFVPLSASRSPVRISSASGTGCLLLRLSDGQTSYVEMVHPQDFPMGHLTVAGSAESIVLTHALIACTMEKGVIIRTRLRGCLIDRANDTATAVQLYEAFTGAELPLSV